MAISNLLIHVDEGVDWKIAIGHGDAECEPEIPKDFTFAFPFPDDSPVKAAMFFEGNHTFDFHVHRENGHFVVSASDRTTGTVIFSNLPVSTSKQDNHSAWIQGDRIRAVGFTFWSEQPPLFGEGESLHVAVKEIAIQATSKWSLEPGGRIQIAEVYTSVSAAEKGVLAGKLKQGTDVTVDAVGGYSTRGGQLLQGVSLYAYEIGKTDPTLWRFTVTVENKIGKIYVGLELPGWDIPVNNTPLGVGESANIMAYKAGEKPLLWSIHRESDQRIDGVVSHVVSARLSRF